MEKILRSEILYTGKVFSVNKLTIELSKGTSLNGKLLIKAEIVWQFFQLMIIITLHW
ncbi:MAG: hypothetical protein IPP02_03875 [Chitinophagaceae bacterium]|nr:hypothetical protein [Chitinophagaceae bacterium]